MTDADKISRYLDRMGGAVLYRRRDPADPFDRGSVDQVCPAAVAKGKLFGFYCSGEEERPHVVSVLGTIEDLDDLVLDVVSGPQAFEIRLSPLWLPEHFKACELDAKLFPPEEKRNVLLGIIDHEG